MPSPAFGLYLVNPARKRGKVRTTRKARCNSPKRKKAKKVSAISIPVSSTTSPIMKTRRRKSSRKNPIRRRRKSSARRNPITRRRRSRGFSIRRNPIGAEVQNIFNEGNLKLAAAALVYTTGTSIILNKMLASQMAKQGSIPGMKPGAVSPIGLTLYKALIGIGLAMVTRKKYPKFAEGVGVGTVLVVGSDLVKQSKILDMLPGTAAQGIARYLPPPRGAGAYTPGVSPTFTGPGAAFIGGGAPRSRGMGTMLTGTAARNLVANGAANFSVAN
jgi:hypothetical protein